MSLLQVRDLVFKRGERVVLSIEEFRLAHGEIVALVGPNASGKSTFLKCLSGLLELNSGSLTVGAQSVLELSSQERARRIAYLGSEFRLEFPLTVFEAVALGRVAHGKTSENRRIVEEAIQRVGCGELRNRLFTELSGGERQRVAIARILAQNSEFLLLDESLSQIDLNHQAHLSKLFKELAFSGKGIILVSHDLSVATAIAQRAVFLKEGKIIGDGPVDSSFIKSKLESLYPDTEFEAIESSDSGKPRVFWK